MTPRVIFAGTPSFAAVILRRIIEAGWDVPLVLSQPDAPSGRGRVTRASAVSEVATATGLTLLTPARIDETSAEIASAHADLMLVAAYGQLIPKSVFSIPAHGTLNVHASLLPRYRGAAPIPAAILAGDPETGVSLMRIEVGLDTGPVYATKRIRISPTDTTGSLTERLAEAGAMLAIQTIPDVIGGTLSATPQDATQVSTAPQLTKDDGRIDWTKPAEVLERHLRAMQPWPGAWTTLGDQRIEILKAAPVESTGPVPGRIGPDATVTTGRGALRLERVKPAGKREMPAADWLRGLSGTPSFD